MTLVGQAANGREAIQQFRASRPDVTLMDIQMPELNRLDALIAIRTEFPDAKVIVLTTYEGDVHILRALKAGAQGYLLKNTLHSELLHTIRAVHAGKRSLFVARDARRTSRKMSRSVGTRRRTAAGQDCRFSSTSRTCRTRFICCRRKARWCRGSTRLRVCSRAR